MAFTFPVELGLIVLFSIIGSFAAMKFKMPSVIGLLITGMIVGPFNLGLIKNHDLLLATIEIGAVLMLFAVGIEFNIGKLKDYGPKVLLVGLFKMGGVFAISFICSRLLRLSLMEGIFIGAIFMISSTVLFIRVLNQKKLADKREIPFLVALLILEDIAAVFTITFFSGLVNTMNFSFSSILISLSFSFLILIVTYLLINYAIKPVCSYLIRYRTDETFTFISLGILGLFTYIAMELKLSPTIGAFLAGNILASHPEGKNMEHTMHPFILTFTSLFFFSLGATVKISAIISNLLLILILFAVLFVSVILTMSASTYLFAGFSKEEAIFSGISMATIGEFGLLLAKESKNAMLSIDLVSITTGIIMISAIVMAVLMTYEKVIGKKFSSWIQLETVKLYFDSLFAQAVTNKELSRKIQNDWKRLVKMFIILLVIFSGGKLLIEYLPVYFNSLSADMMNMILIIFIAALLLALISLYLTASKFGKEFFKKVVLPLPGPKAEEKIIFFDFIAISVLFLILIFLPIIADAYDFNGLQFGLIILIFATFIVLLKSMFSRIKRIVKKNYRKYEEISKRR